MSLSVLVLVYAEIIRSFTVTCLTRNKVAVAIEYFNKTQNNRHSENCKHFILNVSTINSSHLKIVVFVNTWHSSEDDLNL